MLELKSRIPFGPADDSLSQTPWPGSPHPLFTLDWLSKDFLPSQQTRLRTVTAAVADGTKRIEKIRAEASSTTKPVIGTKQPNGNIVRTATDQRLQRDIETHDGKQVVARIFEVRRSLDETVPPVLKVMQRASQAARTLNARYFDRLSCLSRFSAGLGKLEVAQLKANFANYVRGMAPIELHRTVQNLIDEGTPQSLVLLDVCRVENFGRSKDMRAFENNKLLNLIPVAETDQAEPLLQQVVDIYNQALTNWLEFNGQTNRAATRRIGEGLGKLALGEDSIPVHRQ